MPTPQPVVIVGSTQKRDVVTDVLVAVVAMVIAGWIVQPKRKR